MKDLRSSLEHLKKYIRSIEGISEWTAEDIDHAIDHIIVDHCEENEE